MKSLSRIRLFATPWTVAYQTPPSVGFLEKEKLRVWQRALKGVASLVAQKVKRLPAMWETWVRSLGREDSLEKEMATHSSILALKIL